MTTRIATSDLHSLTRTGQFIEGDLNFISELADIPEENRLELIRCLCDRGYRRLAGVLVRRWRAWERPEIYSAEAVLAQLWPMYLGE